MSKTLYAEASEFTSAPSSASEEIDRGKIKRSYIESAMHNRPIVIVPPDFLKVDNSSIYSWFNPKENISVQEENIDEAVIEAAINGEYISNTPPSKSIQMRIRIRKVKRAKPLKFDF